ncbi:MAG: PAS domain-containing protein, partial [Methylophaga sp.]|nr:PAS domain-containing protein [Methylophaga sp.]
MIYKITSSNTVLLVLILATIYFLLGIAGVALANPPGYATEIFPPSGIAFVAVLYFGLRILPGVWLGSVALNMWVAMSSGDIGVSSILIAMSIAVGASLQAWVSSYLIVHVANVKWKYLTKKLDIIWFLLLAGPLACLISASWGNATLLLSNTISSTEFMSGWLDWWIGDISGVILFAPLTLIVLLRHEALWRIRQIGVAVPILLILIVIVLGYVFISQNERFAEQQLLIWQILFVELLLTGLLQILLLTSTGHYHTLIIREKQNSSKVYESESRLKAAQAYAKIGYWELLADKKTAFWSEQMYHLFGLNTDVTPGPESLCDVVHENDFPIFLKSVQESFTTGNEHHVEYRIKRPSDGEVRWIECRGKIVMDKEGKPEKIAGFIQDITEHKLSKEKLQLSARVFSDTQ